MLKAYKYRIYPNNEQSTDKKTFWLLLLCIIRHLHIGKKDTKKEKKSSAIRL